MLAQPLVACHDVTASVHDSLLEMLRSLEVRCPQCSRSGQQGRVQQAGHMTNCDKDSAASLRQHLIILHIKGYIYVINRLSRRNNFEEQGHSSTDEKYTSVPAWQMSIVQQGLCMERDHKLVSSRSYRSLHTARCEGKNVMLLSRRVLQILLSRSQRRVLSINKCLNTINLCHLHAL